MAFFVFTHLCPPKCSMDLFIGQGFGMGNFFKRKPKSLEKTKESLGFFHHKVFRKEKEKDQENHSYYYSVVAKMPETKTVDNLEE